MTSSFSAVVFCEYCLNVTCISPHLINQKKSKLQKTQQYFLTHVSCTFQPSFHNSTQHAVVTLAINGSSTSHMVTSTLTNFSMSNNLYCVHSLAGNSGLHNTTWPSQRTEIQLSISTFSARAHTIELRLRVLKVMQWCGVYCLLSTVLTGSHIFFLQLKVTCVHNFGYFQGCPLFRKDECLLKFPRKQYISNSDFNKKCCYIAWNGQLTVFWINDLKLYTVSYVETRKHYLLWINKVFCTWRPTCWWDVFCSALTGWGGHQRGCSYSYVWIMGKKVSIKLATTMKCCVLCSQLSTEGSHNGETCLDKYVYFVRCSWCCIVTVFKNPII